MFTGHITSLECSQKGHVIPCGTFCVALYGPESLKVFLHFLQVTIFSIIAPKISPKLKTRLPATAGAAPVQAAAVRLLWIGALSLLYGGVWVDLDERQRPKTALKLFGWAIAEGWRRVCVLRWCLGLSQMAQALLTAPAARNNRL